MTFWMDSPVSGEVAASSSSQGLIQIALIAIPNIALVLIALISNAKQHKRVEHQLTTQIGQTKGGTQPLLDQTAALATQQTQIAHNIVDLHTRLNDHLAIEVAQREAILAKIEELSTALNDHIVAHKNDPDIKGLRQSVDNLRDRLDQQNEDMSTLMSDIAAMRKRMDSQERRVKNAERIASNDVTPIKSAASVKKSPTPRSRTKSA